MRYIICLHFAAPTMTASSIKKLSYKRNFKPKTKPLFLENILNKNIVKTSGFLVEKHQPRQKYKDKTCEPARKLRIILILVLVLKP